MRTLLGRTPGFDGRLGFDGPDIHIFRTVMHSDRNTVDVYLDWLADQEMHERTHNY